MKNVDAAGAASSDGGSAKSSMAELRAALAGGTAMILLMAGFEPARAQFYPSQLYPSQPSPKKLPVVRRAVPAQAANKPVPAKHAKAQPAKQVKKEPVLKPLQVPLIAISIANQRMTVYDNGVLVAHAPVSTGTASHPTPMGIFSVIQKERFHVSNIYSGAPMPFMQRITWSGVAMHAGVLPGYPASHGCIRLPHDFATKLYSLTRPGARVIITRNEITPVEFEHQRLFVLHKTEPSKVGVVNEPKAERRSDLLAPGSWIRLAEGEVTVMTDAVAAVAQALARIAKQKPAETSAELPPPAQAADDHTAIELRPSTAAVESPALAEPPANQIAVEPPKDAPVEAAAAPAVEPPPLAEPPADQIAAEPPKDAPVEAAAAPAVEPPAAAPATALITLPPTDALKDVETLTGTVLVTPSPAVAPPPVETPKKAEPPSEPKAAPAPAAAPTEALEQFGPPRPLRPGPITVFVSKKEGKVFVRKAFQPLFDAPVKIARADLPLGTHLFTAVEAKSDGASFRWLAISIPGEAPRKIDTRDPKTFKPAKIAALDVPPPPQTAAQALERIEMPPEALAQISALMSPGASLIISDQGLGPETGLETDFIVLTR